jgi:opacity protein-like surface antigen
MNIRLNLFIVSFCWAGLVSAEELRTTLTAASAYNSNVYGSGDSEESDMVYRLSPEFELRDNRDAKLDYVFSYRGDYEAYQDERDANAYEHRQRLRVRYEFNPLTRITLTQRYRDISNLQFDQDDFDAGDTSIDVRQSRYDRLEFAVDVERAISQRWRVNTIAEYQQVDFKRNLDRSDSTSLGLAAQLRYQLSRRQDLGLEFGYTEQDFKRGESRLSAESRYLNLAALWSYELDSRSQILVEIGPAWIKSEQDSAAVVRAPQLVGQVQGGEALASQFDLCGINITVGAPVASRCRTPAIAVPGLGGLQPYNLDLTGVDLTDSDVTMFGRVSFTGERGKWQYGLSYLREQNPSAGASLAAELDQFAISLAYGSPNDAWNYYSELRWDKRDALTQAIEIDYTVVANADNAAVRDQAFATFSVDNVERDIYTLLLGARYAFTRKLSGSLEARFRQNDGQRTFATNDEADTYIVELAVSYSFDPERF